MKVIVLDIETTGLYPNRAEFLQVTILSGSGRVLFNKYIKPDEAKEWPEAEKVNHISPKMVEHCKSIDHYVPKIQKIIDRADVIVGYNHIKFDVPFLEFAGVNFHDKKLVDVYLELRDNYPKGAKLKQVARANGYFFVPHDSLEDCKATLYLFNKAVDGKTEGSHKDTEKTNKAGSRIKLVRTVLSFLVGLIAFLSVANFLQQLFAADISIYMAMMVSVLCCFKFGLIAGPIIGPLYYLVYQQGIGHGPEILHTFIALLIVSIILKIFMLFIRRMRNKVSIYISGTVTILISSIVLYIIMSLLTGSQSIVATLISFVCLEIVFLISALKEKLTTR